MATQGSPQAPRPEIKLALLVTCVECGEGVEALLPIEHRTFELLLAQRGWFMSALSPPGRGPEVPIVLGALCATCAPKVFPPEGLKALEERCQRILQAAQAPQPPQGTR
jgi:hypothetical protein